MEPNAREVYMGPYRGPIGGPKGGPRVGDAYRGPYRGRIGAPRASTLSTRRPALQQRLSTTRSHSDPDEKHCHRLSSRYPALRFAHVNLLFHAKANCERNDYASPPPPRG